MSARVFCIFKPASSESHLLAIPEGLDLPSQSGRFYNADGWTMISGQLAAEFGDWHTVSSPLMSVVVQGSWDIESSSGQIMSLQQGDILFALDKEGQGHRSRVSSSIPCIVLGIALSEIPSQVSDYINNY